MRWCGLLIDCETLALAADYSRYAGQHVSAGLTLPRGRRPGRALATKLLAYMRPKCHALLLDETINGAEAVRLNIFQAFLLAAMKMHCAARALLAPPRRGRGGAGAGGAAGCGAAAAAGGAEAGGAADAEGGGAAAADAHQRLVLRAIQGAISYMVSLARSRVRLARARLGLDCRCGASRCQVRWLGLVAFERVLRRCARRWWWGAGGAGGAGPHGGGFVLCLWSTSVLAAPTAHTSTAATLLALTPSSPNLTHNSPPSTPPSPTNKRIGCAHRKQARYPLVLAALASELRKPAYARLPRQLAAVVDPARSAVFDQIAF